MFCSEILSFDESPARLDYSALALGQEGSDARGLLKYGRYGLEPDVDRYVRHVRKRWGPARGCDPGNR
jgi:hypothetical protein